MFHNNIFLMLLFVTKHDEMFYYSESNAIPITIALVLLEAAQIDGIEIADKTQSRNSNKKGRFIFCQ